MSNKGKKQKSLKRRKKDKKRKQDNDKQALAKKLHKVAKNRKEKGKVPSTPDGKNIKDLMAEEGVKGDYRDYVVLMADRIVDYKQAVTVTTSDGKSIKLVSDEDSMALMHKKKLKLIVSEDVARKFWHPIFGRR